MSLSDQYLDPYVNNIFSIVNGVATAGLKLFNNFESFVQAASAPGQREQIMAEIERAQLKAQIEQDLGLQ